MPYIVLTYLYSLGNFVENISWFQYINRAACLTVLQVPHQTYCLYHAPVWATAGLLAGWRSCGGWGEGGVETVVCREILVTLFNRLSHYGSKLRILNFTLVILTQGHLPISVRKQKKIYNSLQIFFSLFTRGKSINIFILSQENRLLKDFYKCAKICAKPKFRKKFIFNGSISFLVLNLKACRN